MACVTPTTCMAPASAPFPHSSLALVTFSLARAMLMLHWSMNFVLFSAATRLHLGVDGTQVQALHKMAKIMTKT